MSKMAHDKSNKKARNNVRMKNLSLSHTGTPKQPMAASRYGLDTMEKVYQNTSKVIIDKDIAKGILPFLPLNKMDNKQ